MLPPVLDQLTRRRVPASLPAALAASCALAFTNPAQAYCRTTTCDTSRSPAEGGCQYDQDDCATNGVPLAWPQACVSFSVQKDASPLRGISFDVMQNVVDGAYANWTQADCGGGVLPSIQVSDLSPVNCDQVQYNQGANEPNANIWMFRDRSWPHEGARTTIALTTVTFGATSGQIFDADVEVNSANFVITVGNTGVQDDLQSIVQHESGHTLGLAESSRSSATMYGSYSPKDTSKRTLGADDIAGVCAVYPPGQDRGTCDPTPRHGFSAECFVKPKKKGCSLEGPVGSGPGEATGFGVALLALLWLRRQRRVGYGESR